MFAGAQGLDREQTAYLVNKKLPKPSSYAKPSEGGWADNKLKDMGNYLNFHRALQEQPATPVALLDPILAQVAQDCEFADPSEADCRFTAKVAAAMSQPFREETERMNKFWELLQAEYGVEFHRLKFSNAETDGSLVHVKGGLIMNIEVKNEVGAGGGAVHVQNAAYAAKYAALPGSVVRGCSVCPTLLVELAGPNMSLSGAVFSNMLICDQLSPMVSLLWQPHSPLMLQAARCFAGLRKAIPSLVEFYDSVQSQTVARQLSFPYPTSFITTQGSEAHFTYTKQLGRLCFTGLTQPNDQVVFIKYCRAYSIAAHQSMAAAGCAPALLGSAKLVQGWWLMVQEFIDAVSWDDVSEKPCDSLEVAVHSLHDAGFVHGDLRSCNILVASSSAYVVDFEWAGQLGTARYPYFMNHIDIEWPEGASDGKLINAAHDLWWLRQLTLTT